MATFAEELDEDLIREAPANSQHLLGTPMAHAFKNYGADRAKQAKDAALQAKLAAMPLVQAARWQAAVQALSERASRCGLTKSTPMVEM